jgi:8-oxo-dGTP pyrophosphatase MutT (NUDIX family)
MSEAVSRRCALIYYSRSPTKDIYVLIGDSNGELTTIGGRKNRGETDLDCCCREAFEETKELVDYYPYKHGLNTGIIYTFSGCTYYIIEENHEALVQLSERFKNTHSEREEQNELSELILFNLNKLVEMLVLNQIAYKEELEEFVLTILYRLLKPNVGRSLLVLEIEDEVELFVSLKDLPPTVDLLDEEYLNSLTCKPRVYGKLVSKDVFLTELLYDECSLFRSGIQVEELLIEFDPLRIAI